MPTYVAFLRGVSPLNARMSELRKCLETAGFGQVRTVLASGNVVFDTRTEPPGALERRLEAAMAKHLDRTFPTIVRSIGALQALLLTDPYRPFGLPPRSKRIVTFLRTEPASPVKLPIELDGARILCVRGTEVFSSYTPTPRGPVFMRLIEKTFGQNVTTRTWETIEKVRAAAGGISK